MSDSDPPTDVNGGNSGDTSSDTEPNANVEQVDFSPLVRHDLGVNEELSKPPILAKASPQESPESKLKRVVILVREKLVEQSPKVVLMDRKRLRATSRREFLVFGAGMASMTAGFWWLLPDELKTKFGFTGKSDSLKKDFLQEVLSFDDYIARSLFSESKSIPTFSEHDKTEVPNNYAGQTPDPDFIEGWRLKLIGARKQPVTLLTARDFHTKFSMTAQITRLVCVEGWSAITEWGGLRLHDFINAYPPPDSCRWLQIRSEVNLDSEGNSDPYYVSLDLASAMHPQTLLAVTHNGHPLEIEHGAPLRLIAPMKLGLKNIKAITSIEYCASEPEDYWNKYGYSYYDGI